MRDTRGLRRRFRSQGGLLRRRPRTFEGVGAPMLAAEVVSWWVDGIGANGTCSKRHACYGWPVRHVCDR